MKNMNIIFVFYISNTLLMFISRSIFIKMLGADIAGINSLFNSLIGFLNVAELGIGVAIGYSLYKPLSEKKYDDVTEIMGLFKYYYNRIARIILILGIVLSIFLPLLVKGQINIFSAYVYYYIYLINCSLSYIFTYKQTLIISDQKQYKIVKYINGTKTIKILIQCIFLLLCANFLVWIILEVGFNFLGILLANRKINAEYKNKIIINKKIDIGVIKNKYKKIGKDVRDIFFHKIGGFVVFETDAIMISLFSNLKETAIYANYMLIINSLTGILSNVIGSIMPSIGNLIAEESTEYSYKIFKKLYLFDHILAIFITSITYEIINEFMIVWIGKDYLFSKSIVIILMLNLYIQISRGTKDRFKQGFGIYWDIAAPIIESVVNIVFSIVLTLKFGIIGIFIGTLISNILIIEIWKPYILFKEGFNITILRYIFQTVSIYIRNIIIVILTEFIFNNYIMDIFRGNGFFTVILQAFILSIFNIIIIFVFYLNNKDFRELLTIVKRIFNK